MTNSIRTGYGAIDFPLVESPHETPSSLDPALTTISEYLAAVIRAEIGPAWIVAAGKLPCDHPLRESFLNGPIGRVIPSEPTKDTLTQYKAEFPVLCVYRTGEPETFNLSMKYCGYKQKWGVDWIVGPLDLGQRRMIGGFANPVVKIMRTAIFYGRHPAYNNRINPFYGIVSKLDVVGQHGPGVAQALGEEQGFGYWSVSLDLESIERLTISQSESTFETASQYLVAGTSWGTDYLDMIIDPKIEDVQFPPSGD
jgi:hypothetical protein